LLHYAVVADTHEGVPHPISPESSHIGIDFVAALPGFARDTEVSELDFAARVPRALFSFNSGEEGPIVITFGTIPTGPVRASLYDDRLACGMICDFDGDIDFRVEHYMAVSVANSGVCGALRGCSGWACF